MTNTKVIYIQDDRREETEVQFCYSKDMQAIDNFIYTTYGEVDTLFSRHWEQKYPDKGKGIRNLRITRLDVDEFISMCNLLGYTVKRVNNEITSGINFKSSCLQSYPEDFN